jgi:hypothetical protein
MAFDRIFNLHIAKLKYADLKKAVSLSANYPPRVRKILSRMLHDNQNYTLSVIFGQRTAKKHLKESEKSYNFAN